ncbi:peroxisomal 3-ketoacyl-CoA-thiolase [Pisolithus microcarpus]|nr:peroxisomal 3-ketoacyl-CoA-thiolase [Pisolithus microcarpus]
MLVTRLASVSRSSFRSFFSSTSRTMAVHEAVIVAASRTPVGSLYGSLKSLTAPQLGAIALRHAFEQSKVDPTAGVGQSPARQVALAAGMNTSSDATTINKVCASGLKTIMLAAQSVETGYKSVVAAGGMESMSNAPFLLPRTNPLFGKFEAKDSVECDGLWDVYNNFAMGNCGEAAAEKYGISRESMDSHAIESYKRAERAWKEGVFNNEIAPVVIKGKKGDTIVKEDEEYKKVIFEKVPTLKSAFKSGGSITAANSSNLNDGASALILMSAEKAKELGVKPLARIVSYSDAGVEPIDFPMAPAVALPKALQKANLTVNDIARFEIQRSKLLQIDPAKINVDGGAVALGHAIGNSGSRIVVSLVHALKPGEYGAAGICNGVRLNLSVGWCRVSSCYSEIVMSSWTSVYNLYEEHLSVSLGSTFNRTFGILLSMRGTNGEKLVVKPTKKLMETVTVFHAYDDHSCH